MTINGARKQCSVYAGTYAEAKEKLAKAKQIRDRQRASPVKAGSISLDDAAQQWLIEVKGTKKYSTYSKYALIYNTHLKQQLGNELLACLTSDTACSRISGSVSDSTKKSIYCVLNQILSYSHTHYETPETVLKKHSLRVKSEPVRIFGHTEQARLLSYLYQDMDVCKLGILICLSTGLRLGEICALKWADIDMELRMLRILRTVQRVVVNEEMRTMLLESEPKTACSKREIPIPDQIYRLLQQFYSSDHYLLNKNKPMDPRTYQLKFKSYLAGAGIEDARFHALRHTFATNCIASGADAKSVSEILGHSDVKITLNRYVHPSADIKRGHLNQLDSSYRQYSP